MYTVVEGDSLWEIAERFYGDGIKWKDITTVSNSKNIRPGDRLTIHVKSN
jgi:nucleoid-associated protein YgaU